MRNKKKCGIKNSRANNRHSAKSWFFQVLPGAIFYSAFYSAIPHFIQQFRILFRIFFNSAFYSAFFCCCARAIIGIRRNPVLPGCIKQNKNLKYQWIISTFYEEYGKNFTGKLSNWLSIERSCKINSSNGLTYKKTCERTIFVN